MKWTEVSIGGESDQSGKLGLNNDIKNRQLRHNSQNFQARYFVEIDYFFVMLYICIKVDIITKIKVSKKIYKGL